MSHLKYLTTFAIAEVDPSLEIEIRNTTEGWDEFVTSISKLLDPLSLEFKHAMDENRGIKYYGIVRLFPS